MSVIIPVQYRTCTPYIYPHIYISRLHTFVNHILCFMCVRYRMAQRERLTSLPLCCTGFPVTQATRAPCCGSRVLHYSRFPVLDLWWHQFPWRTKGWCKRPDLQCCRSDETGPVEYVCRLCAPPTGRKAEAQKRRPWDIVCESDDVDRIHCAGIQDEDGDDDRDSFRVFFIKLCWGDSCTECSNIIDLITVFCFH